MATSKYSKAIKSIIRFKKAFDKIDPKIPRKLVGEIGEFYVIQKLERLGFHPEHKGGQGGYDIYLKRIDKRIEVRASLLKNEGIYPDKKILFWGWRVENRNQKRTEKFDYLIGVALNNNFTKPSFYIFNYKEAFSVKDTLIKRFNNIKKKIHLFKDKSSYKKALKLKPELIDILEKRLNVNPSIFKDKWNKIK